MVKRKGRALTRETRQTGTSDLIRDRQRKAISPGKRISKNKNIYYEYRKNRSDVKGIDTPLKYKRKPTLRLGTKKVKLTEEYKRRILKEYDKKEDKNYHTENAVMLVKLFGTPEQIKKAVQIQKAHIKRGNILKSEQDWLLKYGHSHYKKLLPSKSITPIRKRINKKPVPIHNKNGVAKEIMRQLGKPTLFMLGANRFVADGDSLIFFIKGSRKINRIKITLNGRDLYDVEFWKQNISNVLSPIKVVHKSHNIYFDMLKEVIERHTGLSTTMPRVRFI